MNEEEFEKLTAEIQALGYDLRTAYRYAAQIGDTPVIDDRDRVVVVDEKTGNEIALTLDFFRPCRIEADPVPPDFARLAELAKEFIHQGHDSKTACRLAREKLTGESASS